MKNKKIYFVVGIIVVSLLAIALLAGASYSFFQYIKQGEVINVITINGIEVEILNEEENNLSLEKTYPISDSEALNSSPFEFTITNSSSHDISYAIEIQSDTDKLANCTLSDGSSCPELSTDYIKYVYRKNDGTYSEPKTLSSDDGIITSDIITGGEVVKMSVIIWIDSEAGNEIMDHYFYGKLVITGEQV